MKHQLKTQGKFTYLEAGEGTPIIILDGLIGGLSNCDEVTEHFSKLGYKIVIPELPLYSMPLIKTGVKTFANYLNEFIKLRGYEDPILLGNSLGGHIGLIHTKLYPEATKALTNTLPEPVGEGGIAHNIELGSELGVFSGNVERMVKFSDG